MVFLIAGIFTGFLFSLVFEPFLHFLLYKPLTSALSVILYAVVIIVIVLIVYLEARSNIQFSQKKAFKLFFLGISIMSFILAGISFITYPNIIFSGGNSWITYGKEMHFFWRCLPFINYLIYGKNIMVYLHRFVFRSVRSFFYRFRFLK